MAAHNVQASPACDSVWITAPPLEDGDHEHGDGGANGHHSMEEEVLVLDPWELKITDRVPIGTEHHLTHIVHDNRSEEAYVVAMSANKVWRIDVREREIVGSWHLGEGRGPHGIRHSSGRLFVANMTGESIGIINIDDDTVREVDVGGMAVQTAWLVDRFEGEDTYTELQSLAHLQRVLDEQCFRIPELEAEDEELGSDDHEDDDSPGWESIRSSASSQGGDGQDSQASEDNGVAEDQQDRVGLKEPDEIENDSLQNPHDEEATYRRKRD